MNLSKSIIAVLILVLCSTSTTFSATVGANSILNQSIAATNHVDGGPRDVVQLMTDVTVFQPEATNLDITVTDPDGGVRCSLTTDEVQTVISTDGWDSGEYVIETLDDENVYQEFVITVQ